MKRKTVRTALILLFISLLIAAPRAQQTTAPAPAKTTNEDRVALYQALLDLTNPWTVMCIAAHPDDEDGTSLIVMRRKYGAHTVSVFSTFGEGGQNAIGPELYEELGAIRARETRAAAEIQGSEPYFLGLKDFGYSKSADEAFRFWGHEEALRRMVLQIRKLRPDVIITNHSVTNNDHGHHQATAKLELEAFEATADPKRFPEQLKDGVTVWQVQRLFVRAGRSNQAQADSAGVVTIDPNERDPIRDTTFAEEALRALQKHATQGPWPKTIADMARFRNSPDGKLPLIRYVLVREAQGAGALTKESHNFLDDLGLPEKVANALLAPMIEGRPLTDLVNQPERVLNFLYAALHSQGLFNSPPSNEYAPRFLRMRLRVEKALAIASGVTATLTPRSSTLLIRSEDERLSLFIENGGTKIAEIKSVAFPSSINTRLTMQTPILLPPKSSITVPISGADASSVLDIISSQMLKLTQANLSAQPYRAPDVRVLVGESGLNLEIPIVNQVTFSPALEITSIDPKPFMLTPATVDRSTGFRVRLSSHLHKPFEGRLFASIQHQGACATNYACPNLVLARSEVRLAPGETRGIDIKVPLKATYRADDFAGSPQLTIQSSGPITAPYTLIFSTDLSDNDYSAIRRSQVPVSVVDAHVAANLRVGYIRGFDNSLPDGLLSLGVESKELSVDEVKTVDLQKYSAIIVDNRVYESQPELIAVNQRLLDYAKDGGTLIVFYHKSFEWNPDPRRNRPQLAPYPITLGDERITDENAPMTFIEPQHPLLNIPNKIGQEDFAGWIQERGLYYPKDWDAHYQALFASNDPGEAPLRGGLLAADYGRGHYIYTSMVWYRQLRAGVPGAYRMLANMISYGRPTP